MLRRVALRGTAIERMGDEAPFIWHIDVVMEASVKLSLTAVEEAAVCPDKEMSSPRQSSTPVEEFFFEHLFCLKL